MASAARRQIIGGGGGADHQKSATAARPAQGSSPKPRKRRWATLIVFAMAQCR